jgi:hypothetical protein
MFGFSVDRCRKREIEIKRRKKTETHNHLLIDQWVRSAIFAPCAVLLVLNIGLISIK